MDRSYWSSVLNSRISRRRAMAASGATALGAALLSACGGGDDEDKGPVDKSGLLSTEGDSTAKAVPGGIWPRNMGAASGSIDPVRNTAAFIFDQSTPVYSTLLKYGLGKGKIPGPNTITGDAAQSWEISPDGLQITLKLRPNHKFDPRPPTNGRAMTTADVKWSWDRFASLALRSGEILRSKNEAGPIESLSTPDNDTIVIKLAFPYGAITEVLAYHYLYVMPIEAEDKFNPSNEARGSGPFFLTKYEPERVEYRKNSDWYVKGRPFLDGIDYISLPEYAAMLAQLETGALWASYNGINATDVLRVKRDHPKMDLFQEPISAESRGTYWTFSQREGTPFRDVRLRRAMSMAIDRDLFIDTFFNISEFENAGLPVQTYWFSHLFIELPLYIDPRNTKELGEGSKYFEYNPDEARKLVSAAGLTQAVDFQMRDTPLQLFKDFPMVIGNMLEESGFKLNRQFLEAATTWRQLKQSGGEEYNGIFYNICHGMNEDALLVDKYTPQGTDTISKKPIAGVTDQVLKIRQELDLNKKADMVKQLQRDLAVQMLDILVDDQQRAFNLKWPWFKNVGVFASSGLHQYTSSARMLTEYWYDPSART